MSSSVKTIASIALPIAGTLLFPGVGTALGLGLSAATSAAIGGAIGGAAGGVISGGGVKGALKGAALGGGGGYISGGGLSGIGGAASDAGGNSLESIVGAGTTGTEEAANLAGSPGVFSGIGDTLAGYGKSIGDAVTGPGSLLGTTAGSPVAGAVGPTQGSGILGAATRATASIPGVSSILSSPSNLAYPIVAGNLVSGAMSANAAQDAAKKQLLATQQAIAAEQGIAKPYTDAGAGAVTNYQNLANDPNAQLSYVKDSPFYQGLANDAQRRLTASQASAGKLATGGTADALQTSLLNLGNGLVQQHLGNEKSLIDTGANVASGVGANTANLITSGGAASAAGDVGKANAYNSSYQNMINSLLALQNLQGQKNLSGSLNDLSTRISRIPQSQSLQA